MSSSPSPCSGPYQRRTCRHTSMREMRILNTSRIYLEATKAIILRPMPSVQWISSNRKMKPLLRVKVTSARQTSLESAYGSLSFSTRLTTTACRLSSGSLPASLGTSPKRWELRVFSELPHLKETSVSWRSIWVRITSITYKPSKIATSYLITGKNSCVKCRTPSAHLTNMTPIWT